MTNKKIAVIFYSYSGNTRKIVNWIDEIIDADIYELKPLEDYPRSLDELVTVAKYEVKNKTSREYLELKLNVEDYDTFIICTPNWGDTMAPPILTFLKQNHISDANILPVITHEGTGKGQIINNMAKEVINSRFLKEFVDYNNRTTKDKLRKWLKESVK